MLRSIRFAYVLLISLIAAAPPASRAAVPDHWVGTWATSPVVAMNPGGKFGADGTDGTTLREIVHISIGGPSIRVVFTNEFGVEPLAIGAAQVAIRVAGSDVAAATSQPLTFNGNSSVIIPPGALVVSDAATLKVDPLSDLAVSLFLPDQPVSQLTFHSFADQTSYLVPGNVVSNATLTTPKKITSWDFLKGVDVKADSNSAAIVTFGDSITDGAHSTRDANARWPDELAKRLQANKKTANLSILNEGIGGNRLLHDITGPSALARFDRDVLGNSGVRYLIVLEGINDIGRTAKPLRPGDPITAPQLLFALQQIIDRAHAHGIKVFGATLTPFGAANYSSPEGEIMREAENTFIRSGKFDGIIDFDKSTLDPANPTKFLPSNDSGDSLHPNDAGYKVMGDSIDLKLFTK